MFLNNVKIAFQSCFQMVSMSFEGVSFQKSGLVICMHIDI